MLQAPLATETGQKRQLVLTECVCAGGLTGWQIRSGQGGGLQPAYLQQVAICQRWMMMMVAVVLVQPVTNLV